MKIGPAQVVRLAKPPVVEIDTEAKAAYVRFSKNRVAATKEVDDNNCIVTIDLDKAGNVVGVELIGVEKFEIRFLLQFAPITISDPALLLNADYISSPRRHSHDMAVA